MINIITDVQFGVSGRFLRRRLVLSKNDTCQGHSLSFVELLNSVVHGWIKRTSWLYSGPCYRPWKSAALRTVKKSGALNGVATKFEEGFPKFGR